MCAGECEDWLFYIYRSAFDAALHFIPPCCRELKLGRNAAMKLLDIIARERSKSAQAGAADDDEEDNEHGIERANDDDSYDDGAQHVAADDVGDSEEEEDEDYPYM